MPLTHTTCANPTRGTLHHPHDHTLVLTAPLSVIARYGDVDTLAQNITNSAHDAHALLWEWSYLICRIRMLGYACILRSARNMGRHFAIIVQCWVYARLAGVRLQCARVAQHEHGARCTQQHAPMLELSVARHSVHHVIRTSCGSGRRVSVSEVCGCTCAW